MAKIRNITRKSLSAISASLDLTLMLRKKKLLKKRE
jgi:hypothetical protein